VNFSRSGRRAPGFEGNTRYKSGFENRDVMSSLPNLDRTEPVSSIDIAFVIERTVGLH
jgi:hypothetical protein